MAAAGTSREDPGNMGVPAARVRSPSQRFGPDYYRRYYDDPRTRVTDRAAVATLARFVAAFLRHLDQPVRHILDIGCGRGHWRSAARQLWPAATWHGVEYSTHLCEEHGWVHGSVVDFEPLAWFDRAEFDLVICQGVLQYLDDRGAARAMQNLARWTSGALYLEALTQKDWRERCDRTRTDGDVHLRTGAWYRRRLDRHFLAGGGGVFVSKRAGVTLFELEGA